MQDKVDLSIEFCKKEKDRHLFHYQEVIQLWMAPLFQCEHKLSNIGMNQ